MQIFSIGIIGGSDGPTAVFVTGTIPWIKILLVAIAVIGIVLAVVILKKKEKGCIFKLISLILALAAVISVLCALTAAGSGFLNVSNIAGGIFIAAAVIFAAFAAAAWVYSKRNK